MKGLKARWEAAVAVMGTVATAAGYLVDLKKSVGKPLFAFAMMFLGLVAGIVLFVFSQRRQRREKEEKKETGIILPSDFAPARPPFEAWGLPAVASAIIVSSAVGMLWIYGRDCNVPPVASVFMTPPHRRYTPCLGCPVEVYGVRQYGGGTVTRDANGRDVPLAYIISRDKDDPTTFSGAACALKFTLALLPGVSNADVEEIAIAVNSFTKMPNYKEPQRNRPVESSWAYYVEIEPPELLGRSNFEAEFLITTNEMKRFQFVRLVQDQPETFILRINAKTNGIYNFDINITIASKGKKHRIKLARAETFLFASRSSP